MKVMVTGGAGFIGSAVCRHLVGDLDHEAVNVDALTYAACLDSLVPIAGSPRYRFCRADIRDGERMQAIMRSEAVDAVMHLAAESHVDRSIDGPAEFIGTNIVGTYALLEAARDYWDSLEGSARAGFRFHHVSTDEVFGDLALDDKLFTETTPYAPKSPYSASKAASDHLVRAWHRTYGLPVVITNCSNNYGPYQFPEKLIPLMILNALEDRPLPVYGRGDNIRDWLHVEDHARALALVLERGRIGETYNIGSRSERTNFAVVETICDTVDALVPRPDGSSRRDLITFVDDRPGHDRRYAIDPAKIENELGWRPVYSFEDGLKATVAWYFDNERWWGSIRRERYSGERLGVKV